MAQSEETEKRALEHQIQNLEPDAFRDIPGAQKELILKALSQIATREETSISISHSGPLPHPSILQGYEDITPGLADRIVALAERQQAHRIQMEKENRSDQQTQSRRGQIMAFILALLGLGGSIGVIISGFPVTGSVLGGGTLLSLVTVFLRSSHSQIKQITAKKKISG